jgi:hypothetical protein
LPRLTILFAAALVAQAPTPAAADRPDLNLAFYDQVLRIRPDTDLVEVAREVDGDMTLIDLMRPGETALSWTLALSVMARQDAGLVTDAAQTVVDDTIAGFQADCGAGFVRQDLDLPPVPGAVSQAAAVMACGKLLLAKRGEVVWVLAVTGERDLYAVVQAEPIALPAPDLEADPAWASRLTSLGASLALCPRADQGLSDSACD